MRTVYENICVGNKAVVQPPILWGEICVLSSIKTNIAVWLLTISLNFFSACKNVNVFFCTTTLPSLEKLVPKGD